MEPPAGYGPSYSAIWEGEIVPSYTEDYNFYVVGSGTATIYVDGAVVPFPAPPLRQRRAAARTTCARRATSWTRAATPAWARSAPPIRICCDGGYLSYYSFEPTWDAKCIAEVAQYCPGSKCTTPPPLPPGVSGQKKSAAKALQAGVHYPIRIEFDNPTG